MATIPKMLQDRIAATPSRRACTSYVSGAWRDFTWRELGDEVRDFGLGLLDLGLKRGDAVAILGSTRREWVVCDLGAIGAGAVTVGLYPTLAPEGVGSMRYVLEHSESRFVAVEDEKALRERLGPILGKLPRVERIIVWDCTDAARALDPRVLSLAEVCEKGRAVHQRDGAAWQQANDLARPSDLAILIYTSGTTGQPKGAMLSHGNVVGLQDALVPVLPPLTADQCTVSFLPMAHAAERCIGHFGRVKQGYATLFARSMETVLDDLSRARPTMFGSVPRVFEKVYGKVQADLAATAGIKGQLARAAFHAGVEAWRAKQKGQKPGLFTGLLAGIFEKKIASALRARFGGSCAWFITGAAPTALEILEFFAACGFTTFEAYGLTETTSLLTINHPGALRYGTVGKPLPGVEVLLAEDGEILGRGPVVFQGYYKDPDATREAFTPDGWFKTGDIGQLDSDGFLKITDRKKNILITAGGKNITPSNIENEVKSHSPVSFCHLHADKRAYPVALICLDPQAAAQLPTDDARRAAVQQVIDQVNPRFAQYERIRKFAILPAEFSVDGGELTPTMKVKRKVVDQKYAAVLDGLYAS